MCIGHSLGCIWMLKNISTPKAFIAINGFDCFYNHTPKSQIEKMVDNLDRNLKMQMRLFYKACGTDLKQDKDWNLDTLKQGLNWLATWNCEKQKKRYHAQLRHYVQKMTSSHHLRCAQKLEHG